VQVLKKLNKCSIQEIRALPNPPLGVRLACEACCIMLGLKPAKRQDPTHSGKKVYDYWETTQKVLLADPKKFLDDLKNFDKDNIPEDRINTMKQYMQRDDFDPAVIKRANRACEALCMWTRAMYNYYFIAKGIANPIEQKRQMLKNAQDKVIVCQDVALLLDALDGNWHEVPSRPGNLFPLEVATAGVKTDITKAEASVPEDRNRIMNYIALQTSSVEPPPPTHPEFTTMNMFVHSIFYNVELFRLCSEQPEGCMDMVQALLNLRADPNKFVRDGETALHAAVRAERHAIIGGKRREHTPRQFEDRQHGVVEILLHSRADVNAANSAMKTVIECATTPAISHYLKNNGGKPFSEISGKIQVEANNTLQEALSKGFNHLTAAFGGGGAGGARAKLTLDARGSLFHAGGLMKRYPMIPCRIRIRQDKWGSNHKAEKDWEAQMQAVERLLRLDTKCTNPLTFHRAKSTDKFFEIRFAFRCPLALSSAKFRAHLFDSIGDSSPEGIFQVFKDWDKNLDGQISAQELKQVLFKVDPCVFDDARVEAIFKAIDADGSGGIDLSEFEKWLTMGGGSPASRKGKRSAAQQADNPFAGA